MTQLRIILLVSLCAHLAVALASRHSLVKDDAESYVLIGKNLARGNGYVFEPGRTPTSWRGPGYPVLLAAIFKLTNTSYEAVRFVQAFLWVGVALCAWKMALILFGPQEALVAAGIAGFYPEFLGFTGLLWSETLFTLLFCLSILCFVALLSSPRISLAVALGLCLGASILTRSAAVTLIGVIVVAGVFGKLRRSHAVVAIILALLIVAPWTLQNYRIHKQLMLVESNSTQNFFQGARPYSPLIFGWKSAQRMANDPQYIATMQLTTEGERYKRFGKIAMDYVDAHPTRYAFTAFTKTIDFWLPDFFISRNLKSGVFGPNLRAMWIPWQIVTAGVFVVVFACAILSAVGLWSNWTIRLLTLSALLFTLPHSLVYGLSRYHVPLIPLLIALGSPVILSFGSKLPLFGHAHATPGSVQGPNYVPEVQQ